jgi:hypothetical protein
MKRHERQMGALENDAVCHDVLENKGVICVDPKLCKKLYH